MLFAMIFMLFHIHSSSFFKRKPFTWRLLLWSIYHFFLKGEPGKHDIDIIFVINLKLGRKITMLAFPECVPQFTPLVTPWSHFTFSSRECSNATQVVKAEIITPQSSEYTLTVHTEFKDPWFKSSSAINYLWTPSHPRTHNRINNTAYSMQMIIQTCTTLLGTWKQASMSLVGLFSELTNL